MEPLVLITIALQTSEVYGYSCNQFLSSPLVVDATFGFEGGRMSIVVKLIGLLVLCVILVSFKSSPSMVKWNFGGVIWGLALFVKNDINLG
jgi:hypothetical protein